MMKRFGLSSFVATSIAVAFFATTALAQWPAATPQPRAGEAKQVKPKRALAPSPYNLGDVFAAVGGGQYQHYDGNGVLLETLLTGLGGFTTGMAFDAAGNFYGTNFSNANISKFTGPALPHTHSVFATTDPGGACESILRDASGNFFVGQAGGTSDILKLSTTGTIIDRFDVPVGPRGSDWIDLALDQRTMFYTSEGGTVFRYDLVTRAPLSNFSTALTGGASYALRLLPGGGMLVANSIDVKRLNASGAVIQTYDAAGANQWFALNLDPDGTSFWSGSFDNNAFYKFNITTGALLLGPIATNGQLFGLAVFGELTAAVGTPPQFVSPTPRCDTTFQRNVGQALTLTVRAIDPDAGNTVTLTSTALPTGAIATPPLPTTGNPVESVINWTPAANQTGLFTVIFTATDNTGLVTRCTLSVNVTGGAGDITAPSCNITSIIPGPPKQIQVTIQDLQSGLASITPVTVINATLNIPPFTVGTTSPVLVTAAKINQAQSSTVILRATDVVGNSVECDPVYTTVSAETPQAFALGTNYPNPFNPTTHIRFSVARAEMDEGRERESSQPVTVTLTVYDVLGRHVKTLINEPMQAGEYFVEWDGTNARGESVTSGVYLYRMTAGEFVATQRMALMR